MKFIVRLCEDFTPQEKDLQRAEKLIGNDFIDRSGIEKQFKLITDRDKFLRRLTALILKTTNKEYIDFLRASAEEYHPELSDKFPEVFGEKIVSSEQPEQKKDPAVYSALVPYSVFQVSRSTGNSFPISDDPGVARFAVEAWNDDKMQQYLDKDLEDICISTKMKESFGRKRAVAVEFEFSRGLTKDEFRRLKDWLEGQMSDGFGEGFEQQDLFIGSIPYNMKLWWDSSKFPYEIYWKRNK